MRDRLWFFSSVRNWAYNAYVANVFNPDGTQAADDNLIEAYTFRATYQLNQKNKLTAMYDRLPKYRGHREIEQGGIEPKRFQSQRNQHTRSGGRHREGIDRSSA